MAQEVDLKSQISVLEKKAHENWLSMRQTERKLEDAKQESAQLRHRLTAKETSLLEDKSNQKPKCTKQKLTKYYRVTITYRSS